MTKANRKRAKPRGKSRKQAKRRKEKSAIVAPAQLSPKHQAMFLTMNDPSAKPEDRMAAASVLLHAMHKPLPVRYVSMAEAEAELAKAFGK